MIWITVIPGAGGNSKDAIAEMVALADKLQCGVTADINGTQALANPGDDPETQYQTWKERDFRRSRLV